MVNKGIILAGGTGKRLFPITKSINKHILPIGDKPMIYYPLSILMLAKIKNIQIIINKNEEKIFRSVLGPTKDLGINISFNFQNKPNGIGEVFKVSKKFINDSSFCLILGDNFFYGQALSDYLENIQKFKKGSLIFTYPVKNTNQYGILESNESKKKILEKPKKTNSNKAVTGLYVFDKKSSFYAQRIKKSKRNELEIVDILNKYSKNKMLNSIDLGRGASWFDMGTFDDLYNVNSLVSIIEKRQRFKIACLEEIALKNNWINSKNLKKRIKFYGIGNLSDYLKELF